MVWYRQNVFLFPRNFVVILVLFGTSNFLRSSANIANMLEYKFNTTWDNQTISDGTEVTFNLSVDPTKPTQLIIETQAPFFDDPKLPQDIAQSKGFVDGLWNYEVTKIFFLGSNDKYLEVELGPHGHYLVYGLEGKRNVVNNRILLENYEAKISEENGLKYWKGKGILDTKYLPSNLEKFNAYAIHKSGAERRYMSLFPVPQGEFKDPDFHRLKYFGSIKLPL